ncbi:MAG TPA: TetR/AcrR family transcriptional regulator [Acidimicrobiales bacterium]
MSADDAAPGQPRAEVTSWRELAVARSLDSARVRAEKRVQRFLDAAVELINSERGRDFTVQEVVERSGQSLRSFYQYFTGKHELLLALFEDAVRATSEHLEEVVAAEEPGLPRLHRCVVEYYKICRPGPKGQAPETVAALRAMGEFAQQLLTEHPKEAATAFVPLVTLFDRVLGEAADAGAIRPDLTRGRLAGVVLQAIMFNAFATTISSTLVRSDDAAADAEELWDLLLNGMARRS